MDRGEELEKTLAEMYQQLKNLVEEPEILDKEIEKLIENFSNMIQGVKLQ